MLLSIFHVCREWQFWKIAFTQQSMCSFRNTLFGVGPDICFPSQLCTVLSTVVFRIWEVWEKNLCMIWALLNSLCLIDHFWSVANEFSNASKTSKGIPLGSPGLICCNDNWSYISFHN